MNTLGTVTDMATQAVAPPRIRLLRVSRVRGSEWRPGSVPTTGSIEISVGNPRSRVPFLAPQVDWALTHYASIVFSVGDLLQVFNYVELGHPTLGRLSSAEAETVARAEGDAWVSEHRDGLVRQLAPVAPQLIRWDDWRRIEGFPERVAALTALYRDVSTFRDALDEDVAAFVTRRAPRRVLSDRARGRLAQFVIEELAVYQLQAEQAPTVHIYAGGRMRLDRVMASIPELPERLRSRRFAYLEVRDAG